MDNGAYEKYRQEHPVVNTLLSTYDHITMLPEHWSNQEIVLLLTLPLIALYAVGKLIHTYFLKKKE
jgi:hypothetical protein